MIAKEPYIVYSLPQSVTAQALHGGKIDVVWENISKFLVTCTTVSRWSPKNTVKLTAYSAGEDEPKEAANTIIEKAKENFGVGKQRPIGYHYPSGEPHKQIQIGWDIDVSNLETTLEYLLAGQPYPIYNLGPLELVVDYYFRMISPSTNKILPNQQVESSILICLTKRSWIAPFICFPFSEANQEFWNYLNEIEQYLPFRLNKKYLRMVRANKKGTQNVWRKL